MKLEYRPCHLDAGNSAGYQIQAAQCATAMDSLQSLPSADLRGSLDFKQFDPMRPWKRFYRVSKYAKTKLVQWRACSSALTGNAGGFNALPNCATTIDIPTAGLSQGTQIADVTVTWYVRFRYRTRASN